MHAYETTLSAAAVLIIIFLGVIVCYFAVSALWQQHKRLALQQDYLRNEANLLEEERTRIARDLHDEIGTLLWFVYSQLQLSGEGEGDKAAAGRARDYLEKGMQKLGRIVLELTPGTLLDKGLCAALEDLFGELEELFPPVFCLRCNLATVLPPQRSIHFYRIVQEAVWNAVKHARARVIEVTVNERDGWLYLQCSDDGCGFDPAAAGRKKGLGLRSLRSRTQLLGGRMECTTAPGKGTTYFFSFPLKT